jgi:BirA family transcriptional regulator, biotin operon repressor / biotin---[acetyl-CoA-carboxylase] ligase
MPDAYLDADQIRASTFVRHVEIHETLGSTNDRAAELARDATIQLPALVAARNQTAGRGRGKNTWSSSVGALTFSVLLEPSNLGISTANWPQLSLATAVAICDAISDEWNPQSARLAIKWPNDIMLDGAKLCGILIESPGGPAPAKDRVIIGIGINVNNTWHPPSSASGLAQHRDKPANAIALCETTGREHNLQQLLCETLRALEMRITQLALHDQQLPIAWQQLCWLTNQDVEVQANGKRIEGVCLGIENDGTLLVADVFFKTHRIHSGCVSVL